MAYDLARTTFQGRIGETFRLQPAGGEAFDAALTSCDDAPPGFSLVFHGPREPWYPQGIFGVAHDQLGEDGLFLVPLGPDERGMRYEAVIA